jgi:hypothetical protein
MRYAPNDGPYGGNSQHYTSGTVNTAPRYSTPRTKALHSAAHPSKSKIAASNAKPSSPAPTNVARQYAELTQCVAIGMVYESALKSLDDPKYVKYTKIWDDAVSKLTEDDRDLAIQQGKNTDVFEKDIDVRAKLELKRGLQENHYQTTVMLGDLDKYCVAKKFMDRSLLDISTAKPVSTVANTHVDGGKLAIYDSHMKCLAIALRYYTLASEAKKPSKGVIAIRDYLEGKLKIWGHDEERLGSELGISPAATGDTLLLKTTEIAGTFNKNPKQTDANNDACKKQGFDLFPAH